MDINTQNICEEFVVHSNRDSRDVKLYVHCSLQSSTPNAIGDNENDGGCAFYLNVCGRKSLFQRIKVL